jgi:hypothetical protein
MDHLPLEHHPKFGGKKTHCPTTTASIAKFVQFATTQPNLFNQVFFFWGGIFTFFQPEKH